MLIVNYVLKIFCMPINKFKIYKKNVEYFKHFFKRKNKWYEKNKIHIGMGCCSTDSINWFVIILQLYA